MLKKEIVWREILTRFIENKEREFTQKKLANYFSFSLSTIHNALKIPRKSGIIEISKKGFILKDCEKMLNLWATFRNIEKDIMYKTFVKDLPQNIESNMPEGVIFGGYRALIEYLKDSPADYDKVYVYSDLESLTMIKKRFPPSKDSKNYNLFVLKADSFLKNYSTKITPVAQTYVDIWNMKDWYAKEYLKSFRDKFYGVLS
jgi:hypothetical protein